jgi:hypothetical protein
MTRQLDFFDSLAGTWLHAERLADPEAYADNPPFEQLLDVARDRVIAVVTGEVTWSRASPGDRAIWCSRARLPMDTLFHEEPLSPETLPLHARNKRHQAYDQDLRCRMYWNFWDTLVFEPRNQRNSIRIFGNENIGYLQRSNLQVPGSLAGDSSFIVSNFYARVVGHARLSEVPWLTTITLTVGHAPLLQVPLTDAFLGVPCDIGIPTRQNFTMQFDFWGIDLDRLPNLFRNDDPLQIAIHLEGVLTRAIQ